MSFYNLYKSSSTNAMNNITKLKAAEIFQRYVWYIVDAIIIFCLIKSYEFVRNNLGSNSYPPEDALHNAEMLIGFEKALKFYWEESMQQLFLPFVSFIRYVFYF